MESINNIPSNRIQSYNTTLPMRDQGLFKVIKANTWTLRLINRFEYNANNFMANPPQLTIEYIPIPRRQLIYVRTLDSLDHRFWCYSM